MCLSFLFHFGFLSLAQTVKKKNRLENLKSFQPVLTLFRTLRHRQVFMRITVTVVMCQETLTVMTVARGQVSFADRYMWTILMVNLLRLLIICPILNMLQDGTVGHTKKRDSVGNESSWGSATGIGMLD